MSELILFHAPGACSRVTMNALEEIGVPFEDRTINIFSGEQKSPGYQSLNPKGKVPALQIDGVVYTENAAILYYLNCKFPAAQLLPSPSATVVENRPLEDLVWCSSTIHPMVRQVRMPIRFTTGDPSGVKAHGMQQLPAVLGQIAKRVADGRWWYGERWSILDVYLYWNYSTAESGGMSLNAWPELAAHATRVRARPSFVRSLAREQSALRRHSIQLPPGGQL